MASNYAYNPTYNHSNASQVHQPTPYGSGDPYYNETSGFITPQNAAKKGRSKWITIGIPVAIVVIAAAVVGAIFGIRANKNSSSSASGSSGANGQQAAGGVNNDLALFPTATDSQYLLPLYPSTVRVPLMFPMILPFTRFASDKYRPIP